MLLHLQQTPFENIVTEVEIAHNGQFLHLPRCFKLYSIILLLFIEIECIIAADLLNEGKGLGFRDSYSSKRPQPGPIIPIIL